MKNGKFEVGDRVRYVNDGVGRFVCREALVKERVYTVKDFTPSGELVLEEVNNQKDYGYAPERFELVEEDNKTMKNNFKVGDKVRCVDNGGASALKIGGIYTLVKVDSEFVHIDNNGGYYPRRFEIVKEEKKMNVLVIKVDNPILSECIQKLLFKAGFSWGDSGKEKYVQMTDFSYIYAHFKSTYGENRIFVGSNFYKDPGYELLDATKDFAKINEILSARTKPTMVAPKVNGYEAQFKSGNSSVTFGCAIISTRLLRSVLKLMEEDFTGNRKLNEIVLDSGVKLTKDDVSNIIKYVDFVNKNG